MKLLLMLAIAGVATGSGQKDASERLAQMADRSVSVTIYFVTRTGNYDYSEAKIAAEATIVVKRSCGKDCGGFLRPVRSFVEQSTAVKCSAGQQDTMIRLSNGSSITFSNSGRQIKIDGKCFFNDKGIGKVVREGRFLFG